MGNERERDRERERARPNVLNPGKLVPLVVYACAHRRLDPFKKVGKYKIREGAGAGQAAKDARRHSCLQWKRQHAHDATVAAVS